MEKRLWLEIPLWSTHLSLENHSPHWWLSRQYRKSVAAFFPATGLNRNRLIRHFRNAWFWLSDVGSALFYLPNNLFLLSLFTFLITKGHAQDLFSVPRNLHWSLLISLSVTGRWRVHGQIRLSAIWLYSIPFHAQYLYSDASLHLFLPYGLNISTTQLTSLRIPD